MQRHRSFILFLCLALLAMPLLLQAQGNTGGVTGAITDKTGAVVVNADISLKDLATNRTLTAKSDEHGQYIVLQVPPGHYKMTVTAMNFSASVIPDLEINVGKTILTNITLQVGAVSEVVQVEATGAELQTVDASVGNVMSAQQLVAMPNLNRDATSLILFQPGAAPAPSPTADENTGSQIAGARSDQNTFMVDGGDATSNTDANSAYSNNFYATPRAAIPTPVESLEEFRVVTNNNAVGLGRSAGAEVQMVTKRGTNSFHGALYDYMIQDETNATAWQLKHDGIKNPEWRDSRFGARIGGPIIKDRTFFFAHWESRHFLQGTTSNATRWTAQPSILSGLLGYKSKTAPGGIKYINPATQDCEGRPAAPPNTCDPLGLGLNSVVSNIWNQMPRQNTGTGGDGVNFLNYTGAGSVYTNEEFGVLRLDHQINQKWHAMASYRYGVTDQSTTNQVTFNSDGSLQARAQRPMQPRYLVVGVTGQLTNNVTNDLHLGYLRHFWQWGTQGAQPQVAGLGGAMQLVNEGVGTGVVPTNVDTQQARQRNWNGKDWNLIDNMTWLKGSHLFQFGGHYGWQRLVHTRDDIVTYALTNPVYYSLWNTAHSAVSIPIPYQLDAGGNFVLDDSGNKVSDAVSSSAFRSAYAAMMGIVEEANQVRVRDANLGLRPAGTRLNNHTAMGNWEIHFADTWRIQPSFSLTWGLGWGVQMPPFEQNSMQTMMVINGIPFSMDQYLNTKKQYALAGKAYNPIIGFTPIANTGRKYPFDPDYTNLSPRLAFAWNPEFKSSILGKLFGDKHTVFRGGWTRVYDRMTGVDLVMTPTLGVGFGQTASCLGPLAAGGCAGTSGATAATAFRIGVNGNSVAIPDPPAVTAPIEPGIGANPYVIRDYHIDPRRQVGSADVYDLSIQRELPSRMILEVGFIGRKARDLYQKIDTNQIPYMYTMGGQSFAQAYDATQTAIVAGGAPAVQPFWEAALGGIGSNYCSHDADGVATAYASCTAAVASKEHGSFAIRDVFTVFSDLDPEWVSGTFLPSTNQYAGSDVTASRGKSSYAAMFVSLRKSMSHGVQFDANYTLSKSLDSFGWNQDIIDSMMDAYTPDRSYGPSQFDRRHAFNFVATYELPFGKGKRFGGGSNLLDKLVGGWSTSWIFTAASGTPLQIYNSDSCLEYGDGSAYNDCASVIPTNAGVNFKASRHDSVDTCPKCYGSDSIGDKGVGPFLGGYPNIFANPDAVANSFRLPLFSDPRAGFFNGLRGLGRWNVDMSLGKTTRITERFSARFEVQMVNAFNHPELDSGGPATALDIATPSSFGVLSSQYNRPRFVQWGLRFDF